MTTRRLSARDATRFLSRFRIAGRSHRRSVLTTPPFGTLLHSERCQGVLQCIFSDAGVRKGLGAAQQFTGIIGSPPPGLMLLLKQGPGAHMKENAYRYKKQIAAEIAHIERIKNLQTQATAYAVSGIIVLGSTVGPFVASMFYNYMSCGKWFGQCDSD